MKKMIALLFISLVFNSCGELTGKSTGANETPFDKILGGIPFLEIGEGKLLLSGTMEAGGAHSFKMKFNLPEGKSLRFFFFSDRGLNNALVATFNRTGGKTFVNFSLNGESDTRELKDVGEVVDVMLDMHNDHEDSHFILWNSQGPYDDSEECVEDGNCLYNSEFYTFPNDGPWGSQGRAPGTFWGVQGDRSLIEDLEGPLGAVSDA